MAMPRAPASEGVVRADIRRRQVLSILCVCPVLLSGIPLGIEQAVAGDGNPRASTSIGVLVAGRLDHGGSAHLLCSLSVLCVLTLWLMKNMLRPFMV